MGRRQGVVRRPSSVSRVAAWWILVPALLLGVIAMHSMVSGPGQHTDHAASPTSAAASVVAGTDHGADPGAASHHSAMASAPEPAGGTTDLGCGAMLLMCLAVLLVAALALWAGPVRRWSERGRTHASAPVGARRPPFMTMPVLQTTSILRC